MRKLLLLLIGLSVAIVSYSQPSWAPKDTAGHIIRKPLKGMYAKITSDTSLHIQTEEGVLSLKTYPTNFYWVEIDSTISMNVVKLGNEGLVKFTIKFRLYWDYWAYWNWYNPYRIPGKKQEVYTDWIDICAGDGFDMCGDLDTQTRTLLAAYFKVSIDKIMMYNY